MNSIINKEEQKLLNKEEVEDIAGHKVNMVIYDDLYNINNIDDIFKNNYNNCVLLLYRIAENMGHWCAMKKINNKILFFDSYGGHIDDQLSYSPFSAQLSKLLYNCNYDIHYNNEKLQGEKSACCGRFCGLFFKYCKDIDLFSKIFK